jgi:hypothetical protein
MEYRMRPCRLLCLASRTPPRIRLLSLAIVGISAFTAYKPFRPFGVGKEFQALLLARKLRLKRNRINIFKQILHPDMAFGTIFDKDKKK